MQGLRKYDLVGVNDPNLYKRLENMLHNYNNARVSERHRSHLEPLEVPNGVQLMPSRAGKRWVARATVRRGTQVQVRQVLHSRPEDAALGLLKVLQSDYAGHTSREHSRITRLELLEGYQEVV